jgi:outer membrane protein assembly factor BamB
VAADDRVVMYADRELEDTLDAFHALDPKTGELKWSLRYEAKGFIDYGNSPRATPVIHKDAVVTFGAFGDLHVLDLQTGDVRWKKNLTKEFGAEAELKWGTCSSPLVVEDLLIVNPGAKDASIVALKISDGSVAWKSPGRPPSHSSFILATLGGKRQIVGYDLETLGGWDTATGKRLWEIRPPNPKDFNVPTPIAIGDRLFVATENNGARLYEFGEGGKPKPAPIGEFESLAPDSHTPVVVKDRLFGVWGSLFCLDHTKKLAKIWEGDDQAFRGYASLIHDGRNVLATSVEGELLLIDASAPSMRVLSRTKLFPDDNGVYSHPALSNGRLYVRGSDKIVCLPLLEPEAKAGE